MNHALLLDKNGGAKELTYEDINDVLYKQPELNRRCRKVYMRNLDDKELAVLVDSFEFKNSSEYTKVLALGFQFVNCPVSESISAITRA